MRFLRPLLPTVLALYTAAPAVADLFVVSQQSKEVLTYSAANGAYQGAFAKTITEGFRNPGGIAIHPSSGSLYVSSIATGKIWSYTTLTGLVAPPVEASGLIAPFGIDFDAAGTFLYFADASDAIEETTDAIKQLNVGTGVVTQVGANNSADFLGVAVNGSNVFGTDVALDRILRFPVSGGNGTVVISSGLSGPEALVFPTATRMLVADTGNNRVVEYTESGGNWTFQQEVLPAGAGVVAPSALAIAPDGRLTVAGSNSGNVVLVDLTSLVVTPLVTPGAGGLSDPKGLAWSGNTLLVSSGNANAVFYFDLAGQPTGIRAEGLNASLDAGIHISADGERVFVASIGSNDVVEFDANSGARVRLFNNVCPNLPLPFDSVLGSDDRLYISCTLNSSIERFDASTGAGLGSFVIAGAGGLVSPRRLVFGPNENLFVANGSGAVFEFDGVTGQPASPVSFIDANANGGGPLDAYGLQFRGGVLYVSSYLYDQVMAFDAGTGAFLSTFVATGSGGLSGPTALEFGPDGDLYVASQANDSILRYDGATGAFVEAFIPTGSGGLGSPFDLAFRPGNAVPAISGFGRVMLCSLLIAIFAWRFDRMRGQSE